MSRRFAPGVAMLIALPLAVTAQSGLRNAFAQTEPAAALVSAAALPPARAWLLQVRSIDSSAASPKPALFRMAAGQAGVLWNQAGTSLDVDVSAPVARAIVADAESDEVAGYLLGMAAVGAVPGVSGVLGDIGGLCKGALRLLQCIAKRRGQRARARA